MSNEYRKWTAEAPSNIALIKYMGKIDGAGNLPTNTSLSYTLPHLKSIVQLEYADHFMADEWEPLTSFGEKRYPALELSEHGKDRFIAHLNRIKKFFDFEGSFRIRSANDFPSDCGLASSASSFAALTKAAMISLSEITGKETPNAEVAAEWSRKGSGSSCRSFFEPWSIWSPTRISDVPELEGKGRLIHHVVIVNDKVKKVSSSEAHKRVTSSLLFAGRPERADVRVFDFIKALQGDQWRDAFEIAWQEFWDMHALFETSQPPFGYMTSGTLEVLNYLRDVIWAKEDDGPIITMDAGPNIHLLYRDDHRGQKLANRVVKEFHPKYRILTSEGRRN
ncbi:MAG: diphosphomevalonate decarboxylase [Bdellovibrionota bacterium]